MGLDDANRSVAGLRERQLVAADGIVGRCAVLCERVLLAQGDQVDASIVQLHHDCVQWSGMWHADPVTVPEVEAAENVIPLNGHDFKGGPN